MATATAETTTATTAAATTRQIQLIFFLEKLNLFTHKNEKHVKHLVHALPTEGGHIGFHNDRITVLLLYLLGPRRRSPFRMLRLCIVMVF